MSADYPYVNTVDKFRQFIRKLQTLGVPDKINRRYLKSLGYTSSNDWGYPKPLRFIGLIDEAGTPTEKYKALREGEAGKVKLGAHIRQAYGALYNVVPNAHQQDNEALRNFFTAHTDLGSVAVAAMAATFKALCQFATFDEGVPVEEAVVSQAPASSAAVPPSDTATAAPVTINVNIQLAIPPTLDADIYEKLFSSMAKHIMRFKEG
jgi:hypothetical protein